MRPSYRNKPSETNKPTLFNYIYQACIEGNAIAGRKLTEQEAFHIATGAEQAIAARPDISRCFSGATPRLIHETDATNAAAMVRSAVKNILRRRQKTCLTKMIRRALCEMRGIIGNNLTYATQLATREYRKDPVIQRHTFQISPSGQLAILDPAKAETRIRQLVHNNLTPEEARRFNKDAASRKTGTQQERDAPAPQDIERHTILHASLRLYAQNQGVADKLYQHAAARMADLNRVSRGKLEDELDQFTVLLGKDTILIDSLKTGNGTYAACKRLDQLIEGYADQRPVLGRTRDSIALDDVARVELAKAAAKYGTKDIPPTDEAIPLALADQTVRQAISIQRGSKKAIILDLAAVQAGLAAIADQLIRARTQQDGAMRTYVPRPANSPDGRYAVHGPGRGYTSPDTRPSATLWSKGHPRE